MATDDTFRVILRFDVKPGSGPEFEKVWLGVGQVVTALPANRGQVLMRHSNKADVYFVLGEWASEAAFREFEQSDAHLRARASLLPFRNGSSIETAVVVHRLPVS